MVDVDSRIYEVLNPNDHPSRMMSEGSNTVQRSRTVGASPSKVVQTGFTHYAVPRSMSAAVSPIHKPNPPALPPRNRQLSDGERDAPLSLSLGSSPSDHGVVWNGRLQPLSAMSKSPSVTSVGSNQSIMEELSLMDFLSRHSKTLPHRVKVCKGFYGVSERTAVTTGDLLNLHFLKSTKVIVVETMEKQESTKYSIPVSTSIRFCPLYDPNNNLDEARKGFTFETVGDMMSKKVLPKLVKVTKSYQGNNEESSVTINEILVVKSTKSKITGRQQLKVYSLTCRKRKMLSESCAGHFTTAPSQLRLHLYEIFTHLSEMFPYKAILSLQGSLDSVLNDLQGVTVIMKRAITEVSVIATSALDEPEEGEVSDIAEIPTNLDIEVESLGLDENEVEQLRKDTSDLYDKFDPFSVCLFMKKPTIRQYDIQCELYRTLLHGDHKGLDVVRPISISQSNKRSGSGSQAYQPLTSQQNTQTCSDYYVLMNPRDTTLLQESGDSSDQSGESNVSEREHLSLLQSHLKHIEKKLFEHISRLGSRMDHLERRYDSMQTQIRMLHSDSLSVDHRPPAPLPAESHKEPSKQTYHVVQDSKTLEYSTYSLASDDIVCRNIVHSDSQLSQTDIQESNKEYLASLNHQQVLKLLEHMGLKSYIDVFKREQVDGEILSECDEDVLSNDLCVSSKLHRMRIMKIISGIHSAKNILAGEDPYARKKHLQQKELRC